MEQRQVRDAGRKRLAASALAVTLAVLLGTAAPWARAQTAPASGDLPGLSTLSDSAWNELAVRKVLHTFAFGGHASDAQIAAWAKLPPRSAIVQMFTFDEHNLKLSPSDATLKNEHMERRRQTLRSLGELWTSNSSANYMPRARRTLYERAEWFSPVEIWTAAARIRGGNPFRHRVGFWETNFHLAVHKDIVSSWQIIRYYDEVMAALAANRPYEDVIGIASVTAAVNRQYNTQYNRYYDRCYCNEDFAREFHQLGFGILGVDEPAYHEQVSIKNTAAALTGMSMSSAETPNEWEGEIVACGTDGHVRFPVEVQHRLLDGANACEKVRQLARTSIAHPESLENLPIMIVQGMADDYISSAEAASLRRAWDGMGKKSLLRFLRAYAVSTLFHSRNRIKQLTSIDRFLIISNRLADSNLEHYRDLYETWRLYWDEEAAPFMPWHDVFGHQTGPEAASSADLFRKHYTATSEGVWRYVHHDSRPKDWRKLLPRAGNVTVAEAAAWMWDRFVADGRRNFGPLERAHMYALIHYGHDLAPAYRTSFYSTTGRYAPVTLATLNSASGKRWLQETGRRRLELDSRVASTRAYASDKLGAAFAFMIATPFMLAQEGR